MVKYKDIFGTVRMFPFWKDAILYAKERMAMVMDDFEDYQPKIAKRALDDFKDLCVLEHMYTEEEIQEFFTDGIGSLSVGVCTLTYIPTTENCNKVLKYLYDKRNDRYPYASPATIKEELGFEKVGSVTGALMGLRIRFIVNVEQITMPDGKVSCHYYCYNNGKQLEEL
jgi:hypothetical protein